MTETSLFTPEHVRTIDAAASHDFGVSAYALMLRAGAAAWQRLREQWPDATRIGVVCGPGNNGGDGYVVARLAKQAGCDVCVFTPDAAGPKAGPAMEALAAWQLVAGRVAVFAGELPQVDVWVDALYGTGLSRAPAGGAQQLIEGIVASGVPVLSLDVPSGVNAATGHVAGSAIRATVTLSFIAETCGLRTGAARDYTGELVVDPLDIAPEWLARFAADARLLHPDALMQWLTPRHANAHKGEFGHVLAIGGEHGMGGAIRLCAEAALRCGAGRVSAATRTDAASALLAARPEVMPHVPKTIAEQNALLASATVLAVGPGLGCGDWGRGWFEAAMDSGLPMVLDADALNWLAQSPRTLSQAVLTPHPGEAARLLGVDTQAVQADRFTALNALVARYRCVVVLKGSGTLVGAPGQLPVVIAAGNPGMASAGMGDVLTGVIAALLAQHLDGLAAATAGALLHAAAGDAAVRAMGERGLLASDLFPHLRRLANPLCR